MLRGGDNSKNFSRTSAHVSITELMNVITAGKGGGGGSFSDLFKGYVLEKNVPKGVGVIMHRIYISAKLNLYVVKDLH